jgi:hypothetical protein
MSTAKQPPPTAAKAERVVFAIKLPAGLPDLISAAVPAHGSTRTKVVETALDAYLAKPSPEAAMQHARILLNRDQLATGRVTPLTQVNYRLPAELRDRLYERAAVDAMTHDDVTATDVTVAALTEVLLPDHARAVMELLEALLRTHDRDLLALLNARGRAMLGSEAAPVD